MTAICARPLGLGQRHNGAGPYWPLEAAERPERGGGGKAPPTLSPLGVLGFAVPTAGLARSLDSGPAQPAGAGGVAAAVANDHLDALPVVRR